MKNVKDPTLKAILEYKNTLVLCNRNGISSFSEPTLRQIEKDISLLKRNKSSQHSDKATKIIKANSSIFLNFICESINNFLNSLISSYHI